MLANKRAKEACFSGVNWVFQKCPSFSLPMAKLYNAELSDFYAIGSTCSGVFVVIIELTRDHETSEYGEKSKTCTILLVFLDHHCNPEAVSDSSQDSFRIIRKTISRLHEKFSRDGSVLTQYPGKK